MKPFEPTARRRPLLPMALGICLSAGSSVADDTSKDMSEFLPLRAAPAVKRSIGVDDVAKATAHRSNPTEPAWRSGIIESGLAPFPAALYTFENQWHELVGGNHLKVYAGSVGQDPSQGVVVIQIFSIDNRNLGAPQILLAPSGVGSLRITAAKGTVLTLKSSRGVTLTLNAETGELSEAAP